MPCEHSGRPVVLFALAAMASVSGCRARDTAANADASATRGTVDAAPSSEPLAIFSAPIAGARVDSGDAIAVGLVVATHAIIAARVDANGRAKWTRELVTDVAWSPDVELHAWPIGAGAVITWRGPRGGHTAHLRAVVAPDGRVVEPATEIGSLVCATDDGLAWTTSPDAGGARVQVRAWTASGAHDDFGAPSGDEISLTCGAHRAYAVAEGDEGAPTHVVAVGGSAPGPFVTVAPGAMGRDEERDLLVWATGDDFGLVRVSNGGALSAIEAKAGEASPLRADRAHVPSEDDIVAVDADSRAVTVVTTHDESDACPGARGGSSVRAIRIPRIGTAGVTSVKLAPAACGSEVGPFWTEELHGTTLAGWAERASHADKSKVNAPIVAFSWRAFDDAGRAGRVAVVADAIADAGCDDSHCIAVVLTRPAGADGMSPEVIRAIAYP